MLQAHFLRNYKLLVCMEATPSLACANKCVFCWCHRKNPVGKEWHSGLGCHAVEEAKEAVLHEEMARFALQVKDLRKIQWIVSPNPAHTRDKNKNSIVIHRRLYFDCFCTVGDLSKVLELADNVFGALDLIALKSHHGVWHLLIL